jgi:hypothetical protein
MADTTAREQLVAQLAPLLPKSWKLIPSTRNFDETSGVVVQLKLQTVSKFSPAPMSGYATAWVLTVTTGIQNVEEAENQLDDDLLEFLAALDEIDRSLWTLAAFVVDENRFGYDVTLSIQTTKDSQEV